MIISALMDFVAFLAFPHFPLNRTSTHGVVRNLAIRIKRNVEVDSASMKLVHSSTLYSECTGKPYLIRTRFPLRSTSFMPSFLLRDYKTRLLENGTLPEKIPTTYHPYVSNDGVIVRQSELNHNGPSLKGITCRPKKCCH